MTKTHQWIPESHVEALQPIPTSYLQPFTKILDLTGADATVLVRIGLHRLYLFAFLCVATNRKGRTGYEGRL